MPEMRILGNTLHRGVYDARRAAALAGVPRTTLHYWARKEIYIPSVSPDPRTRLWSWLDLLALRAIDWFRKQKGPAEPTRVSIRRLREAIKELEKLNIPRSRLHDFLAVSDSGLLCIELPGLTFRADPGRQILAREVLNVTKPYGSGPDLLVPRPQLRILPGKLHGEPHLLDTRISSATVFLLFKDGYQIERIQAMYPDATLEALRDAIDLEQSLADVA